MVKKPKNQIIRPNAIESRFEAGKPTIKIEIIEFLGNNKFIIFILIIYLVGSILVSLVPSNWIILVLSIIIDILTFFLGFKAIKQKKRFVSNE